MHQTESMNNKQIKIHTHYKKNAEEKQKIN
jgi:hypothetical protein